MCCASLAPLIPAHGDGRRRATLHARGRAVGYMQARSHDLLDIAACPILVPALQQRAVSLAHPIAATIGDCDIAFTLSDTGLDVAIKTERKLKPERLTLLAQRSGLARMSLNGEIVLENRAPAMKMGKALVELPIGSFLQATAMAELVLADLVLACVGSAKSVADLFCGLGPFTLRLAERARVTAADADRAADCRAAEGDPQHAGPEAGDRRPAATSSGSRWCRSSSTGMRRWCSIPRGPAPKPRPGSSRSPR